jgi:hypothetical protein
LLLLLVVAVVMMVVVAVVWLHTSTYSWADVSPYRLDSQLGLSIFMATATIM